VAISPDGKSLAACFKSRGPTLLWDVANQREQVRLSLRREEDFDDLALAFAPGGGRLAVLSADQLRIWDLSTCQVLASIDSSGMSSLAFSPCGKKLATGGWDTSTHVAVRLWNADTGFELKAFEGPNLSVQSVAFSPDGGLVAAASLDGAIHLWSI
jgi:WD40 repeat protein